jgi:hypothetical protein
MAFVAALRSLGDRLWRDTTDFSLFWQRVSLVYPKVAETYS